MLLSKIARTSNLADNVISLAEECIPLLQHATLLIAEVGPVGSDVFCFEA